jgi:hypothetical protein
MKTHCKHGHEYTPENTGWMGPEKNHKWCRQCDSERKRKQCQFGAGVHNRDKTHCKRGHEFSAENTRISKEGWRFCRQCDRIREDEYLRAKGLKPRVRRGPKTHCKHGHEFTPENTHWRSGPRGKRRRCLICVKAEGARPRERLAEALAKIRELEEIIARLTEPN